MRFKIVLFAAALALSAPPLALARDEGAPPTRVETVTDVVQGQAIADPYRWLEDGTNPDVRAWSAAQTARSRAYLDALPMRAAIRDQVARYIAQSSPRYAGLNYAGSSLFAFYVDPQRQQPMIRVMGRDANPETARTVLDPSVLDSTGSTAIDWFVPSHDGRLIAVSLSRGGSEDGTLHIFDVATGREVDAAIDHVQFPTAGGDVAWDGDNRGFWYTRYPREERPEADRQFYQAVYYHRLGDDPAHDQRVFGDGLPRVAEIKLDYSTTARTLLISVQNGDGGEFAHYVRQRDGSFAQVTHFEDGVDFAAFGPDRALYLVSEANASRRQVLKLAPGVTDLAQARVIVPEGRAAIVTDFWGEDPITFAGRQLIVRYIDGGPSKVSLYDLNGRPQGDLDLPGIAAVDEIEAVGNDVLYSVETYLTPIQFYRRSHGVSAPTALRATSPISFADMEVVREMATSRDGTQIPVNIIHRRGAPLDGTTPTLLYGYGGYGVNETPFFLGGSRRVLFDAGATFAIANIRGGGEYGESWHTQGSLTNKQNVFDDFIAAAQLLIDRHYTSPQHLAFMGGSNGGLLMGAVVTQRPDLARAVVSQVGIYDMIRVELDPNGAFNTTEFGSVQNPDQFRALYGYSPYHHVRMSTAYPAMLLTTGDNDGRVNPLHSRKFTAALQAATTSGHPVFLVTRSDTGHGIGTPLNVRIDENADYLSFLFDQLGMSPGSAVAATH